MDRGRLVEQGTHESLLADEHSRYRAMWDAQQKHFSGAMEAAHKQP